MKSLDAQKEILTAAFQRMREEMVKDQNEEKTAEAFASWCQALQDATLMQAEMEQSSQDAAALAGRGLAVLTSAEQKYYTEIIEASKAPNPQQAIANIQTVMPKTIFDRIFDDLEAEHPLLTVVDTMNTGGLIEIYMHKGAKKMAKWGELTGKIVEELAGDFKMIPLGQNKLSAFIPVPTPMLDLGPQWLDRYVRTILGEAIVDGLEYGIIMGAGSKKNEPIGMIRDMSKPEDQSNGFPEKAAIAVGEFSPKEYGGLVSKLAKDEDGNIRKVNGLVLISNTVDYLTKIMPATTMATPAGGYVNNVLPVPTNIIQSEYVPEGKAILGIGKKYFLALAAEQGGKLEFSDQYQFLEDNRVYRIKTYANGQPKDNMCFVVLNISALKALAYTVKNLAEGA